MSGYCSRMLVRCFKCACSWTKGCCSYPGSSPSLSDRAHEDARVEALVLGCSPFAVGYPVMVAAIAIGHHGGQAAAYAATESIQIASAAWV